MSTLRSFALPATLLLFFSAGLRAQSLSIEGAPTDSGFNVGTPAGMRVSLKGAGSDPTRYAVFVREPKDITLIVTRRKWLRMQHMFEKPKVSELMKRSPCPLNTLFRSGMNIRARGIPPAMEWVNRTLPCLHFQKRSLFASTSSGR